MASNANSQKLFRVQDHKADQIYYSKVNCIIDSDVAPDLSSALKHLLMQDLNSR